MFAVGCSLLITLLGGALTIAGEYVDNSLDQRMGLDLRSDLIRHVHRLSGAVQVEEDLVDRALVEDLTPHETGADLVVHVGDGGSDALAAEPLAPVPQLHRLELAGGRARRHDGAPARPDSQKTSTSTVGFPRESRTSRPTTCSIAVTSAPSPPTRPFCE